MRKPRGWSHQPYVGRPGPHRRGRPERFPWEPMAKALGLMHAMGWDYRQAEGNHRRDSLGSKPREDGVVVEPAIKEDRPELASRLSEVVERLLNGGEGPAVVRMESQRGDEPVSGEEDREGGESVGPVGAPLLLRLHHLTAVRVGGLTVVRAIVEVDGDIDRLLRNGGPDLAADRQGERALGLSEGEMAEEPSSRPIRMPPTALGSGAMDGGSEDRRSQEKVRRVADRRRREGSGEGVLQEGKQPRERLGTDLPVRERAGPPSGPPERWTFLSGRSSGPCGLTTAAAAVWVHTESSAVPPSSTGNSIGKQRGLGEPENSRSHVSRPVAKHWPGFTR